VRSRERPGAYVHHLPFPERLLNAPDKFTVSCKPDRVPEPDLLQDGFSTKHERGHIAENIRSGLAAPVKIEMFCQAGMLRRVRNQKRMISQMLRLDVNFFCMGPI